jgi:hypothetical protein
MSRGAKRELLSAAGIKRLAHRHVTVSQQCADIQEFRTFLMESPIFPPQ